MKEEKEDQLIKEQKAAETAKTAKIAKAECQKQEEQWKQIQDALNWQSYNEFWAYAEKQYLDNPDQQAVLIRQLQEQHYYQYMQQVYQQLMENQANALNAPNTIDILSSAAQTTDIDLSTLKISDEILVNPNNPEENIAENDENGKDEPAMEMNTNVPMNVVFVQSGFSICGVDLKQAVKALTFCFFFQN